MYCMPNIRNMLSCTQLVGELKTKRADDLVVVDEHRDHRPAGDVLADRGVDALDDVGEPACARRASDPRRRRLRACRGASGARRRAAGSRQSPARGAGARAPGSSDGIDQQHAARARSPRRWRSVFQWSRDGLGDVVLGCRALERRLRACASALGRAPAYARSASGFARASAAFAPAPWPRTCATSSSRTSRTWPLQ